MEQIRVQAVASISISTDSIPDEFIRSENEQPAVTTFNGPAPEIPIIDLSDPDIYKLTRFIADASRDWGIFLVVNHGILDYLIAKLQADGKGFFELPQEEKEIYAKPCDAKDIEGYGTKLQKDPDEKKSWVDHLFHRILATFLHQLSFMAQNSSCFL